MPSLRKIGLYYDTLKYLKPSQFLWRVYYAFRNRLQPPNLSIKAKPVSKARSLALAPSLSNAVSRRDQTFTFLNQPVTFSGSIDWNFADHGKLWTYNLNYFDYLGQPDMSKKEGLALIRTFIADTSRIQVGWEPYPISLRAINWIKFLIRHQVEDPAIDEHLYAQYQLLGRSIEYHLMGNHLLENAFSLLFGAIYFQDRKLFKKAVQILTAQLREQILPDGGHFELSPMYHQILLLRMLDCYNLVSHNPLFGSDITALLKDRSEAMLGWLQNLTFSNGDIPMFNDSAPDITPGSRQLFDYAGRLGLEIPQLPLGVSGYRRFQKESYECLVDVGPIGPDYIPGHAHADMFTFEMQVGGKPFITDTGTSTYEANDIRLMERSTESHNTVVINDTDQSEVWASFRVGKRARIKDLRETVSGVEASHDGYRRLGCIHTRSFECSDQQMRIIDKVTGGGVAYIHFHPSCTAFEIDQDEVVAQGVRLKFTGVKHLSLKSYNFAQAFNLRLPAKCLAIQFQDQLTTDIYI